ncbi:hypothetical protein DTO217A2_6772 [Paecilomyces variotii]|nr:hypothetical protein DTO217A2_6772 [Paecilomyces variotii]
MNRSQKTERRDDRVLATGQDIKTLRRVALVYHQLWTRRPALSHSPLTTPPRRQGLDASTDHLLANPSVWCRRRTRGCQEACRKGHWVSHPQHQPHPTSIAPGNGVPAGGRSQSRGRPRMMI